MVSAEAALPTELSSSLQYWYWPRQNIAGCFSTGTVQQVNCMRDGRTCVVCELAARIVVQLGIATEKHPECATRMCRQARKCCMEGDWHNKSQCHWQLVAVVVANGFAISVFFNYWRRPVGPCWWGQSINGRAKDFGLGVSDRLSNATMQKMWEWQQESFAVSFGVGMVANRFEWQCVGKSRTVRPHYSNIVEITRRDTFNTSRRIAIERNCGEIERWKEPV